MSIPKWQHDQDKYLAMFHQNQYKHLSIHEAKVSLATSVKHLAGTSKLFSTHSDFLGKFNPFSAHSDFLGKINPFSDL